MCVSQSINALGEIWFSWLLLKIDSWGFLRHISQFCSSKYGHALKDTKLHLLKVSWFSFVLFVYYLLYRLSMINFLRFANYENCHPCFLLKWVSHDIYFCKPKSGSRTNGGVPNVGVDKRRSVNILILLSISIQIRLG